MASKNLTKWQASLGSGVTTIGNLNIVTNSGNLLVDNTTNHYPIVTTPQVAGVKAPTLWVATSAS